MKAVPMSTRTVAVTGADGFIGSHVVETLVTSGYHVRAMVQYNSTGSWGWMEDAPLSIHESVEILSGDVRDRDSVRALLRAPTWSPTSPRSSRSPTRTRPRGRTWRPTRRAP
jgi:nucleoside-diphosphate-sugar epimerase